MSKFKNKQESALRMNKLELQVINAIAKVTEEEPELNEREITIVLLKEAQAINRKELNTVV